MSKLLYKLYGVPVTYLDTDYSDVAISKVKATHLQKKMKDAPTKGLLIVKGNAGPIVNQLYKQGRTMRGIDFPKRSQDDAFSYHDNPEADMVIIFGVGCEVTTNYRITSQVLNALIRHYSTRQTLVIIETHFTKSELRDKYDLTPGNFIALENKPEEVFI